MSSYSETVCVSVRTLRLTVEQKCNIATRELDELREDRQRKEEEFERASDNHRVGSCNRTVDWSSLLWDTSSLFLEHLIH